MKVQDKVVLITGASSGIGLATAKLLAKNGALLALSARSKDKLEQLSLELKNSLVVVADMTKPDDITRMVAETVDHFGRIDILINNAGQSATGRVDEVKLEDFKHIMDLNVYGPLLSMQAVVPQMLKQGYGMIVNISSNVSKMAIPGIGAYAATKYALNGLTLTARAELADKNIVVSLMHPMLTDTDFGKNAIVSGRPLEWGHARPEADSAEAVAEKILETINSEVAEQYMREIRP